MARKVKCRITGEMVDKELAIQVDGKYYTEALYADFALMKERKNKCIIKYKKMIGASERMPVPAINKIVDQFVEWYSVDALELALEQQYTLKGNTLQNRVAYLKAILNNTIVPAQETINARITAEAAQPIIEVPVEVLEPVATPKPRKRRSMFF